MSASLGDDTNTLADADLYTLQQGSWTSGCTQRVVMAAYEKELEVEMKPVDMANVRSSTSLTLDAC